MDSNRDGLLNFKELVQILDAICKGDHITKLKIFYCLHLPGIVLPGELDERGQMIVDNLDTGSRGDSRYVLSYQCFICDLNNGLVRMFHIQ